MRKRMMRKAVLLLGVVLASFALGGCTMLSEERVKLKDLEFTVLSEDKIPEELKQIIEEKKTEPFKLTYSDNDYLYICIGYGMQQTGGYSIAVNELYLTDNAVYVNTSLLGPEASERSNQVQTYPYIVIKTDFLDETVIFE